MTRERGWGHIHLPSQRSPHPYTLTPGAYTSGTDYDAEGRVRASYRTARSLI